MQYIYQKVSQTYNWLSEYYYGKEQTQLNQINMTKEEKIIALRKVLKQKNMFSQQINGKIQMQFTKLIQNYQHTTFTTNKPLQYPIPFPNKQEDSKQTTKMKQQPKTITFTIQTILQSDKIKCPLTINCLLEQTYPLAHPKIFIDYPTLPTKLQTGQIINITSIPNPQFVSIVPKPNQMKTYKYKARTGGIEVVFNINKREEKIATIKQLIDESIQIMKGEFPFLKSKNKIKIINQQTNMDQKTNNIYQISKNLKKCLLIANQVNAIQERTQQSQQQSDKQILPVDILRRGQQLDILLKSIDSELNYQTQQNHKLQNVIKTMQQQADRMQSKQNLSQYYPIVDQSSQQMYDVLVDYQATKDCLVQIQSQLRLPNLSSNKQMFSSDQLQNRLNTYQLFNQKVFYQRIKINQIIKKQQQQKQQFK